MEYADDGDLKQRVEQAQYDQKLLDQQAIMHWFTQIVLAVKYIHDNRILHRDIKIQNIFVTKSGLIKLGDFGTAKKLDSTEGLANTSLGTPYYISPEICEGKFYNHKTDIWMVGCVLYEMYFLDKPFEGKNIHVIIYYIYFIFIFIFIYFYYY